MGGRDGKQQKKLFSAFSVFNIFKSNKSRRRSSYSNTYDEAVVGPRKIWPSDEDKDDWVADPDINAKATAFIDNFKNRVSQSECQTIAAP